MDAADARAISSELFFRPITEGGTVASVIVDLDQWVVEALQQLAKRLRAQVRLQVQLHALALSLW
ncbi:hypothetical protein D3C79_1068160 [compost metagenome]